MGLALSGLTAIQAVSQARADSPAPVITTELPEAEAGTITTGGAAGAGAAVTTAEVGEGIVIAADPPADISLIVLGAGYGIYKGVQWLWGSHHHVDVQACSSNCGTIVVGYGANPPQWTSTGNNGGAGWNLTGVYWPSGVRASDVGNEISWLGYAGITSIGWGGHSSPTSAPAPGWGTWMSSDPRVTGLKGECMIDPAGDIVQVWGDSYELCGVIAPNQLHSFEGETDCTGNNIELLNTPKFYEDDASLPDLPIPTCPPGEVPWHIVITESTWNPQTGIKEGGDTVEFEWSAPWGPNGPPDNVKNCVLAVGTANPCIVMPTKYINGEWVSCADNDCRGYPVPMPAKDDTRTAVTGTDGETYGCSWGPIIPAPIGDCADAPDPGTGATSTSDDPRLPAVIDHLKSTSSTLDTSDESKVDQIAEVCLQLSDGAGLADNPCANEPIFAPGSDNPGTTANDWDGLFVGRHTGDRPPGGVKPHPEWFELERTSSGESGWYLSGQHNRSLDPAVVGPGPLSDCYKPDGQDTSCDEYPFNKTNLGAGGSDYNAALQQVGKSPTTDLYQNQSEGAKLNVFYNSCDVQPDLGDGGSQFLVVPMVFPGAPVTGYVCGP